MTRYEQGFLTKCAEYGVDAGTAIGLLEKTAWSIKTLRPTWSAFSNRLRSAGGKVLPTEVKNSAFGRYAKRFLELLGGGNANAKAFTGRMSQLKNQIMKAQSEGNIELAKELTRDLNELGSTVSRIGGVFGKPRSGAVGINQVGTWQKYFSPFDFTDLKMLESAPELNKVKWARRGGMAALAAPVALPMASSVLGGGGGGFDGGDEYAQYQQPQYGNVPVYR